MRPDNRPRRMEKPLENEGQAAIIDRLIEGEQGSGAELDEFLHYLNCLVRHTAAHQSRNLIASAPPERLVSRQSEYPTGSMAWMAESYVESYYPIVFDDQRPVLAAIASGEERWKALRWRFITWLHETWAKEEGQRHQSDQVDQDDARPAVSLASQEPDPVDEIERLRALFLNAVDPIEAWTDRNRHSRQWRPFIELLRDTNGTLALVILDRPQSIKVPSQRDVDDAWFRALWRKATEGGRPINIRDLARVCGVPDRRVDYLIRLEKRFTPTTS